MAPETSTHPQDDLRRLQRRTVAVLSLGQILGGVAFGATISLGAVLAAEVIQHPGAVIPPSYMPTLL